MARALQSQLHVKIVEAYEPIQAHNARNVILDILNRPDRHIDHARRFNHFRVSPVEVTHAFLQIRRQRNHDLDLRQADHDVVL